MSREEARRIAVAGVSRTRQDAANLIYGRFETRGYEMFPVNPNAERVEGDPCFPDLRSPAAGVTRVWMHQSMIHGASISAAAAEFCRANGITVIAGACPMMFGQTGDFGHKCMRWVMGLTGRLPV